MALMQKARLLQGQQDDGGGFKKPDVSGFIPEGARDAVDRVVAAGMRIMYAPESRQKIMAEIQRKAPVPQKIAEAMTGLLLILDQKSKGGIPMAAIFPAALELLGEAGKTLEAAGQTVTQEDYNEAARMMFVLIGKKLGASKEQLMGTAEQVVGGQQQGQPQAGPPEVPQGDPQAMPDEEMA